MSKLYTLPDYPIDAGDTEVCVNVVFYYHPAFAGNQTTPPEPNTIEIVKLEYVSGAMNEVHEAMLMTAIEGMMANEDFVETLEDDIWEHVREVDVRAQDAYYDELYEREVDRAVMAAQEEDA